MRKLTGLCFLTATLLAASANAQGIFIDRGDPNTVSAMVGGGLVKNAWGASAMAGYSYRGVFDIGAEFARYAFTAGTDKNLAGWSLTPFATYHALRAEADEMPFSMSVTLGVQRIIYSGNGPVASPEGWGLVLGPSFYRRFELGSSMVVIPELFVAYDFSYTRRYSQALDQKSNNVVNNASGAGYTTDPKHNVRALVRPNLLVKAGNTNYVFTPYVGFQGALAAGLNLGAMF
jgi:hypothetical protein